MDTLKKILSIQLNFKILLMKKRNLKKSNIKRRFISQSIYSRLPEKLKMLTEKFDGREKDIILLSCIGTLSNIFPNTFGEYYGKIVYPHLYIIIIAPPASGKGLMSYAELLIKRINTELIIESQAIRFDCEKRKKKNDVKPCPEIVVKILPANSSTSKIYSFLGSNEHGVLIMESEADTLSKVFSVEWSNFSDVLRKSFHHEKISISRKSDNLLEYVEEPKLAIVLSGTPNQLKPLLKSRDDGLFSRFIIYSFDEISEFKNVFSKKLGVQRRFFKKVGDELFDVYFKLTELKKPIEFIFTKAQEKKFYKIIKPIRQDIIDNHHPGFIPNLYRHGIILFRIAMILTAFRNKDKLYKMTKLVCNNNDFMIAIELVKTLLRHSQFCLLYTSPSPRDS